MNHTSTTWTEADQQASEPDFYGKWISVEDRLPESKDDSVLVWFSDPGSIGMVHIQDYFDDITNGMGEDGNQLYTKWYISQGVTHWMPLPPAPQQEGV